MKSGHSTEVVWEMTHGPHDTRVIVARALTAWRVSLTSNLQLQQRFHASYLARSQAASWNNQPFKQ